MIYSVYGLTLASNLAIPGLLPASPLAPVDLTVTFGGSLDSSAEHESAYYVSRRLNERLQPTSVVWRTSSGFRIKFEDGVEFFLDGDSTIRTTYPSFLSLEYVTTYLVGFVLGFVLRLRQCLCLHAAAVVIDGRAVALLGIQGAGKSTTAATFSKLGYSVLSDDNTPLVRHGDVFMVQPGYPRINLWPGSVRLLYGTPDALPLITRGWDKRYLDLALNGGRFSCTPAPLAAIYILGQRVKNASGPFAQQISGPQAFLALVQNTYVNLLLDQKMRAQEFDAIGELVVRAPVRRIAANSDPTHLHDLCEGIVSDVKSLPRRLTPNEMCTLPW